MIIRKRTPVSDFDTVPVNDVPADAVILDVREDYEWVAGHADGAVHIPLDQLPTRLDELDPDQDLYVICRTGGRSFRAAQWLNGQGYTAINVAGGMDQWLESGKPLVSDNGLKPLVL
jgi:rhodanese-related sulfurtransferase